MTSEQNQSEQQQQQPQHEAAAEMTEVMEAGGGPIPPNFDEFLQTGRTGRRNAMPHIMSQQAAVGTGDLPCEMGKLTCTDSSVDGAGTSSSGLQNETTATNEDETPQA